MSLNTNAATSSGAGLALGVVLVFIIGTATGIEIPAEVGAAVGTLCTFLLGLFIPPPRARRAEEASNVLASARRRARYVPENPEYPDKGSDYQEDHDDRRETFAIPPFPDIG
jgi:hypothetical protein